MTKECKCRRLEHNAEHRQAGDVDDPAKTGGAHLRQHGLHGLKRGAEIEIQDARKVLKADIVEELRSHPPDIVDHAVDVRPANDIGERRLRRGGVAQVHRNDVARERRVGVARNSNHTMAAGGQPGRDGTADAL